MKHHSPLELFIRKFSHVFNVFNLSVFGVCVLIGYFLVIFNNSMTEQYTQPAVTKSERAKILQHFDKTSVDAMESFYQQKIKEELERLKK